MITYLTYKKDRVKDIKKKGEGKETRSGGQDSTTRLNFH